MGDGGKIMALELVLEDKIHFEATECNHSMLFKKMIVSSKTIFGSYY